MTTFGRSEKASKMIAAAMRHSPDAFGIVMHPDGSAEISEVARLLTADGQGTITTDDILWHIENSTKKRYGTLTRDGKAFFYARQGHSFPVEHNMKKLNSSDLTEIGTQCFHGTKEKFISSIKKQGLRARSRTHVHLSQDEATAITVGDRRKETGTIIITIDLAGLVQNQDVFISENGVILTEKVGTEFFMNIGDPT